VFSPHVRWTLTLIDFFSQGLLLLVLDRRLSEQSCRIYVPPLRHPFPHVLHHDCPGTWSASALTTGRADGRHLLQAVASMAPSAELANLLFSFVLTFCSMFSFVLTRKRISRFLFSFVLSFCGVLQPAAQLGELAPTRPKTSSDPCFLLAFLQDGGSGCTCVP
jgi:hypothetical protein